VAELREKAEKKAQQRESSQQQQITDLQSDVAGAKNIDGNYGQSWINQLGDPSKKIAFSWRS